MRQVLPDYKTCLIVSGRCRNAIPPIKAICFLCLRLPFRAEFVAVAVAQALGKMLAFSNGNAASLESEKIYEVGEFRIQKGDTFTAAVVVTLVASVKNTSDVPYTY